MVDFRRNSYPLLNKVGGALSVGSGRNTGEELVVQQLCMFMLSQSMVVVGDGPPTSHWGGTLRSQNEDVSKDAEGVATAKGMGKRVAEVALKMAGIAG